MAAKKKAKAKAAKKAAKKVVQKAAAKKASAKKASASKAGAKKAPVKKPGAPKQAAAPGPAREGATWLESVFDERKPCGTFTGKSAGSPAKVAGWALRYRDQGGLVFVDLRDRTGLVQIVFDKSVLNAAFDLASTIRGEFVLAVEGKVRGRARDQINPKLPTGEIEILVSRFEIVNAAKTPPFNLDEYGDEASEEHRLRYRYLDIRRNEMYNALAMRSKMNQALRRALEEDGFIEVETPILGKSTPEGARDFLVPSRINPGQFYALPQSPQIFKQILMVGGVEKHYQIARCFRDEDLRADRQPEFTQLDLEMSFVDEELIMQTLERLWIRAFEEVFDIKIQSPLPRITYADAMEKYGNDRPDLRFDMPLRDVADIVEGSRFNVFVQAIKKGGRAKALAVPGGAQLSRKDIDDLTAWVGRDYGAKGLAWLKYEENGLHSTIAKFFTPEQLAAIAERCEMNKGDIVFFAADRAHIVNATLGNLRLAMGKRFDMIPADTWAMLWVYHFPLFERDPDTGELHSVHHPFTAPEDEDMAILTDPDRFQKEGDQIRSRAYDLVLNGTELGGGSVRIHQPDVQSAVFTALGISPEAAKDRFGFLLDALDFGAPPHGGAAFGLDRAMMLGLGRDSIRDVIAFPKTQKGADLMSGSPSGVDQAQLRELRIKSLDDSSAGKS